MMDNMVEPYTPNESSDDGDWAAPLSAGIFNFFSRSSPFEGEREFLSETVYNNFNRMKVMAISVMAIFLVLGVWDVVLFMDGKWHESDGHRIVACLHLVLIVFLAAIFRVTLKKKPETPARVTAFHKNFVGASLASVLLCISGVSAGDIMTSGSTVAYLGAIFAYAAIFIMTHRYSLLLFGINMLFMVFLLIRVPTAPGHPISVEMINVVSFTVVAFILSRILFSFSRKNFTHRMLIQKQSIEISRQNQEKETLIGELRNALDEVKTLSGFLPICAACKKIRDDEGYWNQLESYIQKHSNAQFSHSYCPDCAKKFIFELDQLEGTKKDPSD